MTKWISLDRQKPPENQEVHTVLMDMDVTLTGPKQREDLKYLQGKWVRADGSEVEYIPTHWRPKE